MAIAQPLHLALLQGDTRWHDPAANRAHYGSLMDRLQGPCDLILLPETWATGFTNAVAKQAEAMDGPSVAWMRDQAAQRQAVVAGSLLIREGDATFNRLVWMRPDGSCETYDKRHLFRMAREHEHFTGGERRVVVSLKGWRVLLLVCYDLRFPVWARNGAGQGALDYDLMVVVANWPTPRRTPWRTLLRARAMENLACVAGLNRVGTDGQGHPYSGDSVVLDAQGEPLIEGGPEVAVLQGTLDPEALARHRERFPAWRDADRFELRG